MESEPKNISYGWLAGILITAIGGLLLVFFTYWNGNQQAINESQASLTQLNSEAIASLNSESLKQTALLVVIAEKDGISAQEVQQLLGLPGVTAVQQ